MSVGSERTLPGDGDELGDYLLQAQWMLNGTQYACSVKVQVRAPGIRAEGCWSTEGDNDDLDLHMAKINGFNECETAHGWSDLPAACTTADEDCYYGNCYSGDGDTITSWGYPNSPPAACNGWGSQAAGGSRSRSCARGPATTRCRRRAGRIRG